MYNKITLIGNCGDNPTMRYTPAGAGVTEFSLATNYRYKRSDGVQVDRVEWFRVKAWGKLSEVINEYVIKGMRVYVEGRLESRPWTNRDGQPMPGLEVTAMEVKFLSAGRDPVDQGENGAAAATPRTAVTVPAGAAAQRPTLPAPGTQNPPRSEDEMEAMKAEALAANESAAAELPW